MERTWYYRCSFFFFGLATVQKHQICLYLAIIPVAFVSSTVMFQLWELDNTKVLHDGWLPVAVGFVGQYFAFLLAKRTKIFIKIICIVLYFCAIYSGILNQILQESYPSRITIPPYMKIGKWVSENTNTYSLFHCPRLEAPPAQIGERQLLSGYGGWVFSHGLANHTRNMYMNRLNQGDSSTILRLFEINYLYNAEPPLKDSRIYPADQQELLSNVFKLHDHRIWRVT